MTRELASSGFFHENKNFIQKFIETLQNVFPHLGKDESKIVSALIILALKLEGIIGKDISEKDSNLIEILKEMIIQNEEKKDSAIKIAERLMKSNNKKTNVFLKLLKTLNFLDERVV